MKAARKAKAGDGQYIGQPGLSGDRPDTILGKPFDESEYFDTWGSDTYQAICGDFSFYWIVDALTIEIQVLTELFAATNQTAFVIRCELDAMPVISEAFARLKLA